MNCITCDEPLSEARLAAKPDAVQCTRCVEAEGDEPKLLGVMTWEHKTAPTIEIGTKFATAEAGRKHRYGPHISLNGLNNPRTVASVRAMKESSEVADLVRESKGVPLPQSDDNFEPVVNFRPAIACHPERPAATPGNLCLECALNWYKR